MATLLTVKASDTRDWSITLSDADSAALNLTGARVKFRMRRSEQSTTNYFVRDTEGTGSDFITINATPTTGIIAITPTLSDYSEMSDMYGIFVAEFLVIDSNEDTMILNDVEINIQEPLF